MRTQIRPSTYRQPTMHAASTSAPSAGWITELSYSEDHSGMTQQLLLPLLQQLSTQSRWQLWLTPPQKLNREWLQRSGLPLDKIMQIPLSSQIASVEAMIKALSSGNYSVVLGWIAQDITPDERLRLDKAAAQGQALGLIMRPQHSLRATSRPTNQLKIQSTLYH